MVCGRVMSAWKLAKLTISDSSASAFGLDLEHDERGPTNERRGHQNKRYAALKF